jgi:hypothetical protein
VAVLAASFVPEDFAVPRTLQTEEFRLEPLGPQHNVADHAAWTASIDHIRSTPGFAEGSGRSWPPRAGMTAEENLADLARHAADFDERAGFTYTVIDRDDEVIGCVYIYPSDSVRTQARVRSWVRADRAELDRPLYEAVIRWLATDWPFTSVDYDPRA